MSLFHKFKSKPHEPSKSKPSEPSGCTWTSFEDAKSALNEPVFALKHIDMSGLDPEFDIYLGTDNGQLVHDKYRKNRHSDLINASNLFTQYEINCMHVGSYKQIPYDID